MSVLTEITRHWFWSEKGPFMSDNILIYYDNRRKVYFRIWKTYLLIAFFTVLHGWLPSSSFITDTDCLLSKISGSHCGDYGDDRCVVRCSAV
jgi:hypothetical protein